MNPSEWLALSSGTERHCWIWRERRAFHIQHTCPLDSVDKHREVTGSLYNRLLCSCLFSVDSRAVVHDSLRSLQCPCLWSGQLLHIQRRDNELLPLKPFKEILNIVSIFQGHGCDTSLCWNSCRYVLRYCCFRKLPICGTLSPVQKAITVVNGHPYAFCHRDQSKADYREITLLLILYWVPSGIP